MGRSRTDTCWKIKEYTWEQLVTQLKTPLRTSETVAEYHAMSADEKGRCKDHGGFVGGEVSGGRRIGANVLNRCLITLDADNASLDTWEEVTCLYDNWRMCVYSTHSHSPNRPKLRWVLPLSRPVSPEEYECVARWVANQIDINSMDITTYQPSRLMYWPSVSQNGEFYFKEQDGYDLDPDEILASFGPDDAWKNRSRWPTSTTEERLPQRTMKRAGEPTEKPGIVGLFCRTYDVPSAIDAFLSDVYAECYGGMRYTYLGGSTSAGAVLYEGGAFLYSNHSTDPAGGQCLNSFDLVRVHKFGAMDEDAEEETPVNRLPSYKAMCEFAVQQEEVISQMAAESAARADSDFSDLAGAVSELGNAEEAETSEEVVIHTDKESYMWAKKMKLDHRTGKPTSNITNATLILANDPQLKGVIADNLFRGVPVLRKPAPWRLSTVWGKSIDPINGDCWTETDDSQLRQWFECVWGEFAPTRIADAFKITCRMNAYHPVREYLSGVAWDGVERGETLLIDYMGAADTRYTRAVTRMWLIAAVARIFEPGCKFDTVLTLVGKQGGGKSTLGRLLAKKKEWFSDSITDIHNKDAMEGLQGVWIVEMGELAALKHNEVEGIKNFLSRQVDHFRRAYDRRAAEYPRQCVFYGTTNKTEFLKDETGNRRFWPVNVDGDIKRVAMLAGEVDQIWAEAMAWYRQGEKWWTDDPELIAAAEEAQAEHKVQDTLIGEIHEFLDEPLPENWYELSPDERRRTLSNESPNCLAERTLRRDSVCLCEIKNEMMGQDWKRAGFDGDTRHIGDIMNVSTVWERCGRERVPGYGLQRVYRRRPENV